MRRHPLLHRRVARTLATSIILELLVDAFAGVAADLAAPIVGDVAYIAAGVVIVGTAPLLVVNVIRVICDHQPQADPPTARRPPALGKVRAGGRAGRATAGTAHRNRRLPRGHRPGWT